MKTEGLENLTPKCHIEGKRYRRRQRVIYLTSLWEWMMRWKLESLANRQTLRNTMYRKLWRNTQVLKGHGTQKSIIDSTIVALCANRNIDYCRTYVAKEPSPPHQTKMKQYFLLIFKNVQEAVEGEKIEK